MSLIINQRGKSHRARGRARKINRNNLVRGIPRFRTKRNNNRKVSYTQPGRFAPDKLVVKLIWQDTSGSRAPTGTSPALNWGFRSSAYDPDPALLTGALPGFAEISNLYSEYCVHSMVMNLEVANPNTENLILVAWPSNTIQNVNSLTRDDLAEYSGNVNAQSQILGAVTGFNIAKMRVRAAGMQLVGPRFRTDLDYSSPVSTNPVQMYYINVGAYQPTTNIVFPIIVKCRVTYTIEFFKLRQLES